MHWRCGKVFQEAYSDYAVATELGKKEKPVQVATLKTVMGKECRQILGRLELREDATKDAEVIMQKLESYFEPTQNILYKRYLFREASQQPQETIDQYTLRLRHLAETCDFKNLHDEMI